MVEKIPKKIKSQIIDFQQLAILGVIPAGLFPIKLNATEKMQNVLFVGVLEKWELQDVTQNCIIVTQM